MEQKEHLDANHEQVGPGRLDRREGGAVSGVGRLTPSDIAVLRLAGRHRFVTVAQAARGVGRAEKKVYPRLLGMRSWGLVDFHRPLVYRGVYVASRAGLATAGLALPPARIDVSTFHHDRLVTDVAIDAELAGAVVLTEREMRSHDENPDHDTRYAVTVPSGGRHYPDLLVEAGSGRWRAIEVELSPKNKLRRERILAGYARARHIDTVTYYAARSAIADLLSRSITMLGLGEMVTVEVLPRERLGVAA